MALLSRSVNLFSSSPRHAGLNKFSTSARRGGVGWAHMLRSFGALKDKLINESVLLLRSTILQIDYITANRLKRVNSLAGLYNKMYEKEKLLELMRLFSKNFRNRSKRLLWGATVFSVFDWENHKVKDEEMLRFSQDIDTCRSLTKSTLTCGCCGNRLRIEKEIEQVKYCACKDSPKSVYGVALEKGDWTPFLERKDIIVWRKEHPTNAGMYIYKMYGRFDDVSADEFMRVQLDMSEFRMSWDTSTAQCFILDSNVASNQEVYYWEVNWPRFFSNRDYCCVRQTFRDEETGSTVLLSRSTDHPHCPVKRKCLRVSDYDSVLSVKPFNRPDQLGMEFCLTGFENPGVQLPEAIITWVAIRGMPEFMQNLRSACIKLREYEDAPLPSPINQSITRGNQSCADKNFNNNFNMNSSSPIYA